MVAELVGRARRRYLWNEILAQGAWASSGAMGAVIILLLLGTEILDWHWLVLIPGATLGIGAYRTSRRLPSAYVIAQTMDRRLKLADTLSTALFFATSPPAGVAAADVRRAQMAQAERVSQTVRLCEAVPFTMPRAVYTLAVLGLAASSLFALRYGVERRLDLQKPLARILQQALGLDRQQQAAVLEKKPAPAKRPDFKDMQGVSTGDRDQSLPGQLDAPPNSNLDNATAEQAEKAKKGAEAKSRSSQEKGQGEDAEAESTDEASNSSTGDESASGQQGEGKERQGQQSAAKQSPEGAAGNNSSLMAKFKEAMQNLLSRMRQQPAGSQGSQSQQLARGQNARQGKQTPGHGSQNGNQQGKQSGGQESNSQDGQSGEDAQMAQNATGRGSSQGAEEQNTKQPGSGIGRQDGSKDLKAAEQLAAMGKISEIIGKRSANVTGEVTVEVQSNDQRLQTPYSQRNATHTQTTAEINRDEVPVALQAYVQQYFEQVRKTEASRSRASRP